MLPLQFRKLFPAQILSFNRKSYRKPRRPAAARKSTALQVEELEARWVPATLTQGTNTLTLDLQGDTVAVSGNTTSLTFVDSTGNITVTGSVWGYSGSGTDTVTVYGTTSPDLATLTINDSVGGGTVSLGDPGPLDLSLANTSLVDSVAANTTTTVLNDVNMGAGNQAYDQPVTLVGSGSAVLTGDAVSFYGNVSGPASNLTIDGNTIFGNGVDVNTTTGSQTYNQAVMLGSSDTVVLTGNTVTFNGNVSGSGSDLTVDGNTVLANVAGLDVNTTTGNQTYNGTVTLDGNSSALETLWGGTITLDGNVTGTNTSFYSDGTTILNAASVNMGAQGSQAYYVGTLTLDRDVNLTGSVFLDEDVSGANTNLTCNGSTYIERNVDTGVGGNQTYDGSVSLIFATTLTGNTVTFNGDVYDFCAAELTVNAATVINASTINTSFGPQTYCGAVSLATNATLTGSDIVFDGNLTIGSDQLTLEGNASLSNSTTLAATLVNSTVNGEINEANGSIDLGSANLALTSDFTYSNGAVITLVDAPAAGDINGTFNGLPPASRLTLGDNFFTIAYDAVTLTAVPSDPTVSNISPSNGPTAGGTTVTLSGTEFESNATVTVGGVAATNVVVLNSTTLTFTTPTGTPGAASIVVTNPDDGSVTATNAFAYLSQPTITNVSPNSGTSAGGTGVTLTGTQFEDGATVTVGGLAATDVVVVNSTTITFTTPSGGAVGPADVVVTNPDNGTVTDTGGYTYTQSVPTITNVSPNRGPTAGDTTVTLSGTQFERGATVTVGGVAATDVIVASSTTITFTTPAGAVGSADVVVTNPDGGTFTDSDGYTYTQSTPTFTNTSPLAVATTGTSTIVFAIAADGAPYLHTAAGGWTPLGAAGTVVSISASTQTNGTVVLFALGTDGSLSRYVLGVGWEGEIGAAHTVQQISAGTDRTGQADVFVINGSDGLDEWSTSAGWQALPNSPAGAATQLSAVERDRVYVVTANQAVYGHDPSLGWFALTSPGFAGSISATGTAQGNDTVYAVTPSKGLYEYVSTTGWTPIGGNGTIETISAGRDASNQANVFTITTAGDLAEYDTVKGWMVLNPPSSVAKLSATVADALYTLLTDGTIEGYDPTFGFFPLTSARFAASVP